MTLFLMVGLPASGKTTRAEQIAVEHKTLRFSPDEWMKPLFSHSDADGKRDVLEARLLCVTFDALRLGMSVVLDFGFWSREERSAIRALAAETVVVVEAKSGVAAGAGVGSGAGVAAGNGVRCELVYLPVDADIQQERVNRRQAATPERTFPITPDDLRRWREQFEEPDADELRGGPPPEPPQGWSSWREWAADRWPSFA